MKRIGVVVLAGVLAFAGGFLVASRRAAPVAVEATPTPDPPPPDLAACRDELDEAINSERALRADLDRCREAAGK
jgi:hypothetical protein